MATLSEWIAGETTDGVALPADKVAAYRARHRVKRALAADGSPGIVQRAITFATSAAKHVAAGSPKASQEVIDNRLAICQQCDKFSGSRCTVCGCGCSGSKTFLNKLSWADQECPHPDGAKWGKANV